MRANPSETEENHTWLGEEGTPSTVMGFKLSGDKQHSPCSQSGEERGVLQCLKRDAFVRNFEIYKEGILFLSSRSLQLSFEGMDQT